MLSAPRHCENLGEALCEGVDIPVASVPVATIRGIGWTSARVTSCCTGM